MRLILLLSMLCIAAPARAQAFKCPEGTQDSGERPGMIMRWCETQDGRQHGPMWRWHRNGQIRSRMTLVYGTAEGEEQEFHENGKPASRGMYSKSLRTGPWKFWDEEGRLETEVVYGESRHQRINYYPNGRKLAEGTFTRTGKIGPWTYWGDDGRQKAQCDFGEGLFALTSDACRVIAAEVRPEGFSPPIPQGAVQAKGGATLAIAHEKYQFAIPAGWVADAEAGKRDRVPLVFYQPGGSWRGPSWSAYVRPLFKEGAPFEQVVARESQGFARNVAEYAEQPPRPGALADKRPYVTKTISYRSMQRTDSPFAIAASGRTYESLTFLDASPNVVLMIVVTAADEKLAADAAASAASLVASVRGP